MLHNSISDSTSTKSDSSSLFSILKSSDEFMPSGESSDVDKVGHHLSPHFCQIQAGSKLLSTNLSDKIISGK
jgi:hypothetical protein